jgi:electron transfer flavoprotein beta subunit
MKIIVLIKQVPDTMEVKIDPKTGTLMREGVKSIINPDDMHALETALCLKEEHGGTVIAVSMGPDQAIIALSEALGMGVDTAILLSDRTFAGADTWATSTALGRCVELLSPFDMVMCGRQAIDGDTAQIGPQVAEYLHIPQITYTQKITATEKGIIAERRLEDGYERIECSMPCLVTVIGGIVQPRYPTMQGLIQACSERADIKIWNAADLRLTVDQIGLKGSLTQVIRTFSPKHERKGEILQGSSAEKVITLVDHLKEQKLI